MTHMGFDLRVLRQLLGDGQVEKARLVFGNGQREHFASSSALISYLTGRGPVELTSESTVLFKDGSWLSWDYFWENPSCENYPNAEWVLHKRPNW